MARTSEGKAGVGDWICDAHGNWYEVTGIVGANEYLAKKSREDLTPNRLGCSSERCALFVIIALGESLLVTGATFAAGPWNLQTWSAFVVAAVGAITMWCTPDCTKVLTTARRPCGEPLKNRMSACPESRM